MASNSNVASSSNVKARVILLGEPGAGKSSLFHRFKYKHFKGNNSTEGLSSAVHSRGYDACVKYVRLADKSVEMTIMDSLAVGERGQSINARFFHRVLAVLLVCSLDNEQTLLRLPQWIEEAKQHIKDSKTIYIVVGMKSDILEYDREVSSEALRAFGNFHSLATSEVSAKTGEGVNELLRLVAQKLLEQPRSGGTSRHGGSSRRHERQPLIESCDKDGFTTTRDLEKDQGCCGCVLM